MRVEFEMISLVLLCIFCLYDAIIVRIKIENQTFPLLGKEIKTFGKNLYYFSKIPYAKPPVGNRRFRYPEKLDNPPWLGTYDSNVQPATCWQGLPSSDFELKNPAGNMWFSKTNMSEDCLYLTIWTPQIDLLSRPLPVMIWIYGGSYMSGSNTLEVYDGSILSSLHNVVVVSFQFRIGPLGFLYLDNIESPGNQALMDQQMVFQWVHNHISIFGGDPNSVTLFGESSGATSISVHLFSKNVDNLFQRAILQSGTIFSPWAIESSSAGYIKGKYLAKQANCSHNDNKRMTECLRSIRAADIVDYNFQIRNQIAEMRKEKLQNEGYNDFFSDSAIFFDIYFRPIYDQKIISKLDVERITEGKLVTNKDLLIGTNANEAMYFLMYGLNNDFQFFNSTNIKLPLKMNSATENFIDPYKIVLENILDLDYLYPSMAKLILHEYGIKSNLFGDNSWTAKDLLERLDLIGGDTQFICPTVQFADAVTKSKSTKLFMYLFNCRTGKIPVPDWLGVMHGYEIEYVFGMPFSNIFSENYYSFNDDEKQISKSVMEMWTNFAKYGDPTPNNFTGNLKWPSYTIGKKIYLKISNTKSGGLTVENRFKQKQCRFWTKVLPNLLNTLLKRKNGCSALLVDGLLISWIMKIVAPLVALRFSSIYD